MSNVINKKDLADVANIIKNMLLTYWIKIETKARQPKKSPNVNFINTS